MTVKELCNALSLEALVMENPDIIIDGCYCSDLLSHCMSNISENNIWITVQVNINIIAIAVLTGLSAIIIAQDMPVPEDVVTKAKEEGINLLTSSRTAYELCTELGKIL